jgi:hypothetical protein
MIWREPKVPEICERLIGCLVPQDGEVLVISYEGTHVVRLSPTIAVETDDRWAAKAKATNASVAPLPVAFAAERQYR